MKIIFLDIDGVMKPARSYLLEGNIAANGGFDVLSVAAVNRICERCDAKIVFNTTWNMHTEPTIEEIAKSEGITGEIIGKTKYPRTEGRLEAIRTWIADSGLQVEKWVALDDATIAHKNAVLVDPRVGITVEDYINATDILGNKDSFIVLI